MGAAPTRDQLLILADRAERGPLTSAEADRLRAGIRVMDTARRSAIARLAHDERQQQRLAAIESLVGRARARGASTVALWALGRVFGDTRIPAPRVEARRARQGPSVPVSRPNSARGSLAASGPQNGAQSLESSLRRSS
ncbi:hypothetical protein [Streptomyces flavidovirens]